jgi:HK97 family phage prohead protease
MNIERSALSGQIIETKLAEIDGVPIGIVSGHIATWKADNSNGIFGVPDRILKGAYTRSLQEHKARHNRQIRLKDHHMNIIGGFPIETAKEDNIGLFAEGHINLETKQGQEVYSLARQGVLVDFSVGHIVLDDRIENGERLIIEAKIIEGSIVDEPKNQRAQITEIKGIDFPDLPIAVGTTSWNEDEARAHVMELKFSDGNGADAFIGDHIIADVITGKLLVIPAALHLAAQEIKISRDKTSQVLLERYFGKMEIKSPFDNQEFYTVDDVRNWSNAELKSALLSTGIFSNGAVRALVARAKDQATVLDSNNVAMGSLLENIKAVTQKITR